MGLEALRVFGSGGKGVWVCIGLTPQFSPKGITCSCPASVQLTQPKGSRDSCGSYGFWLCTANLGLQHKAGGPLPFIGILLTFGLMQTSPTARITDLQPSRRHASLESPTPPDPRHVPCEEGLQCICWAGHFHPETLQFVRQPNRKATGSMYTLTLECPKPQTFQPLPPRWPCQMQRPGELHGWESHAFNTLNQKWRYCTGF